MTRPFISIAEAAELFNELTLPRDSNGKIVLNRADFESGEVRLSFPGEASNNDVQETLLAFENIGACTKVINGGLERHLEIVGRNGAGKETRVISVEELSGLRVNIDAKGGNVLYSLIPNDFNNTQDNLWTELKVERASLIYFCELVLLNSSFDYVRGIIPHVADIFCKELFSPLISDQDIQHWDQKNNWSEWEAAFILNGYQPREQYYLNPKLSWLFMGREVPELGDSGLSDKTINGVICKHGAPSDWRSWYARVNSIDTEIPNISTTRANTETQILVNKAKELFQKLPITERENINQQNFAGEILIALNKNSSLDDIESARKKLSKYKKYWHPSG